MFCIQGCSHHDEWVKTHYISNKAIAEEVLTDLQARFNYTEMDEIPDKEVTWDPGGMLMMNDADFIFNLGDIAIHCKAQHFPYFVPHLNRYSVRGTNTKYVKIHGHYSCICITPEEFEILKKLVDNPEYAAKAEEAMAERERRVQSVVDSGHLVRVAKDAAGNLIDIDAAAKQVKVDKKDLN